MGQPYDGRLLLKFKKDVPEATYKRKPLKEKVRWFLFVVKLQVVFLFCFSEKVYGNDDTKKVSYCVLFVLNGVVLLALY